jgi:hypothetical protein
MTIKCLVNSVARGTFSTRASRVVNCSGPAPHVVRGRCGPRAPHEALVVHVLGYNGGSRLRVVAQTRNPRGEAQGGMVGSF